MSNTVKKLARRLIALATFGLIPMAGTQAQPTYPELWAEVERLESLSQPREAMKVVDQLMIMADKERQLPQKVKAVVYHIKLSADFEEDAYLKSAAYLEELLAGANGAEKAVLGSLLAEVRWRYLRENHYRVSGRTYYPQAGDRMEWWDLPTFSKRISGEYLASLGQEGLLQSMPVREFALVLVGL
ncbi:MAG TPA: hypothetical protein P5550_04175, partial [Bacteroidales bacterium]|nr:hypothetical protein [Bacteroidales bacterium]